MAGWLDGFLAAAIVVVLLWICEKLSATKALFMCLLTAFLRLAGGYQEVIITGTNLTEANIEVPDGIDKQSIIIQ